MPHCVHFEVGGWFSFHRSIRSWPLLESKMCDNLGKFRRRVSTAHQWKGNRVAESGILHAVDGHELEAKTYEEWARKSWKSPSLWGGEV
jgi:hypothetical protein